MVNNEHYKFEGYNPDGSKRFVSKKSYPNEIKAQVAAFELNLKPHGVIHKVIAYKCSKCGMWHLGHHKGKKLTNDDIEKIKKQYEKFKIVHGLK